MVRGIRNTAGLVLAVVGAAAALWAPFRNWYDGRLGRDFRVWEFFTGAGVTDSGAGLFASMFLPLLVGAVLTVLAVVSRSRLLVLVAGIAPAPGPGGYGSPTAPARSSTSPWTPRRSPTSSVPAQSGWGGGPRSWGVS